jgi:hypothetical protein
MTSSIAVQPAAVLDVDQLAAHVGEGLGSHAPQNVTGWFGRLVSVGPTGTYGNTGSTSTRSSPRRSTGRTYISFTSAHQKPGVLPLILSHGWPGSVVEFLDVIGRLAIRGRTTLTHESHSTW